jgi:hypothetical protein
MYFFALLSKFVAFYVFSFSILGHTISIIIQLQLIERSSDRFKSPVIDTTDYCHSPPKKNHNPPITFP